MTKTYTITREDLKAKKFKEATEAKSGTAPEKRELDLLVEVLKRALSQ